MFVVLFELLMPYVVTVLAPGFHGDAQKLDLAIQLCRITFPFLLLIAIVSFQGGILNAFDKFAAPASAPIILNLTMIFAAFVLVPFMPTAAHGIAWGITLAGILEVLWLYSALRKIDVRIHPYIHLVKIWHNPDIRTLFKRIAPGIVGAGIYQINMAVDTILVSLVGTGAISWLYYANRLQQLPLGVVGAAISVALLPILSKALKAGDVIQARSTQDKAVEYGALLSFPAMVILIVAAYPIVSLLFEHGKFLQSDSEQTALAVIAYSVGLPCYVMTKALMPNFFARGDTVTPVKYSAVVFAVNLVFNLVLMQWFGHVGIAMATTIAAFVSLGQYIRGLYKRDYWKFSRPLLIKLLKIAAVSLLTGALLFGELKGINQFLPQALSVSKVLLLFVLGAMLTSAAVFFLILAKISGIIDFAEIMKMLRKK